MKRGWVFAVVLFLLWPLSSLGGEIKELHPVSFSSNGSVVAGWRWLMRPGHYAEWTFLIPLSDFVTGMPVGFCFSTLSTNRVNGGAGYDSSLKVVGVRGRTITLSLKNACSCLKRLSRRYSGNSHGIGYESHGCFLDKITPFVERRTMDGMVVKVRVEYAGDHHTAVRKDSLKIVYTTR